MKSMLLLALVAVPLLLPTVAAEPTDAADANATIYWNICGSVLTMPPNPFVPTSPAGQLYAGAAGTASAGYLVARTAGCIVLGVANQICVAETGRPCV